jgi:TcpE family
VELPTYTNIWKIEKRLYKLYDFRLPMPLPVGQLATFLAIAVPYMLILTAAGMPFSHTWVWLYVLPPAVLAWLVTRPVLEGKRLPELVLSQLRYLSEPRTWCRMAPLAEKDVIAVAATVWRRPSAGEGDLAAAAQSAPEAHATSAESAPVHAMPQVPPAHASASQVRAMDASPARVSAAHATAGQVRAMDATRAQAPAARVSAARAPAPAAGAGLAAGAATDAMPERDGTAVAGRPVWPNRPAFGAARAPQAAAQAEPPAETEADSPAESPAAPVPAAGAPVPAAGVPARPAITVRTDSSAAQPLRVVERALRSSPGTPASGWHDRVVLVPGGHRPGKPDQVQRDQARARLPLERPARIVVLGCTAGAGQTVTTLLTGQILATLRDEPVAVLDLSPGPGSLTELARRIPRLIPGRQTAAETAHGSEGPGSGRERRLQVVTAHRKADEPGDVGQLMAAVTARYPLTLADPAAVHVPRAVEAADQLLLVTPANADAGGALAMTLEWLDAHGHADLARAAITVLNGVSDQTMMHAEKAAAVASGRCRAIVRVPWDSRLSGTAPLSANTVHACTALAGVLVAGLVGSTAEAQPVSAATGARQARSADE